MSLGEPLTPEEVAELSGRFTTEEQNAAAWLSVVLLMAENRAMSEALRKLLVEKEVITAEESVAAIKTEVEQPNLGNWYGFMNQLYAFRVAETLEIQHQKKMGELSEEESPKGELVDIAQAPIPTGPPDIRGAASIIQTDPSVEGETNEPSKQK